MTGWIILAAVLALLTALCLLKVGAEAAYDDVGLQVWLRIGGVSRQLFPKAKITDGKTVRAKQAGDVKESAQQKKKGSPLTSEQLPALIHLALTTLKRFLKKLRIEILRLHVLFGGADPANTAMAYIAAASVMEMFQDAAGNRIGGLDLTAGTDFSAEGTVLDARLRLVARLGPLTVVGIAFLLGYLKIKRQVKKGGT